MKQTEILPKISRLLNSILFYARQSEQEKDFIYRLQNVTIDRLLSHYEPLSPLEFE